MSQPTPNSTRAVALITFHGLSLVVAEHKGVEYINSKPLAGLAGIHWKTAKRTLSTEANSHLYGTQELQHPVFEALGSLKTPETGLYIRLDRAHMFLARIDTARMKANGSIEAADKLLALQVEWAEALHSYETHGVAYKKAQGDGITRLINLIKTRNTTRDAQEQQALSYLIQQQFAELGQPLQPEPDLFNQQ